MFKVYIVYESSDYGLWDMTNAKIFSKFKDAEAYNEEYYNQHGHTLIINEWDVEQAEQQQYIHGMIVKIISGMLAGILLVIIRSIINKLNN